MSIERDHTNGTVTVTIGDRDVLTGTTHAANAVRVWFAPLPTDHGLTFNVAEPRKNTDPPADVAATVYFLNREALTQFIAMLTTARDKSFPVV